MSNVASYMEAQALLSVTVKSVDSLYFKKCDTLSQQRFLDEAISKLHEAQSLVKKAKGQINDS